MKAPDKIYVHVRTEPRPSITFSEVKEKGATNEEYIRKEALLEWANKLREAVEKAETDYALSAFCSTKMHDVLVEGLDKLNEL